MKTGKHIPVQDRYMKFLRIYATFKGLGLSERELEIIDQLYWLSEGKLTTQARKEIQEALDITDFNLNNQLRKIRSKGLIVPGKDGIEVLKSDICPDIEAAKKDFGIMLMM